jgi:hypothetical protein
MSRKQFFVAVLISALMLAGVALSQAKPLTNDDVVAMVKGGLPETTIINAIDAQASNFDVSATALINLKKQGVSAKIMDAMVATASGAGQPSVALASGAAVPISKTQIVSTKTKANSLGALSTDSALGQAMQQVAMTAATQAAWRAGSYTGASALGAAGGVMGGLMAKRKPTVTYVWALPGQKSDTSLENSQVSFAVHFANIPGVNADEYEPALVKLAPSPSNFRLVGATQAKQDVFESNTMDWQVYSSFIEERVAAQATKVSTGEYKLQPSAALPAGEYGVVLRPINKDKKYGASTVAQNSGEGLMFNSVWAFGVK